MSMTTCKECKSPVSDTAATCPKCGAKVPPKTKKLTWAVVGVIGLLVVVAVANKNDTPTTPSAPATKIEPTPESKQVSIAREGAAEIKRNMRDPDSLKFDYIGVNNDGSIACFRYRAKNGFGGMNSQQLVLINRKASMTDSDIKKHCVTGLNDWTIAGK